MNSGCMLCVPLPPSGSPFLVPFLATPTHPAHCPPLQCTVLLPADPPLPGAPASLPPAPWVIAPKKLLGQRLQPCVLEHGLKGSKSFCYPLTTSPSQPTEEPVTLPHTYSMAGGCAATQARSHQASQEAATSSPWSLSQG